MWTFVFFLLFQIPSLEFSWHFYAFIIPESQRSLPYGRFLISIMNSLNGGDLKEGFARVRCPNCAHEFLLQFSCKVRCFCPSCQAKRVIVFGHHLKENVFFPVPHRQYVFSIPIMLRIYFKHNRSLLTGLCQCAYKSLLSFLRKTVRLKEGVTGVVMAIHTFGEYPEKFHPHIHAIVTDGLFTDTGLFHVMKRVDLKPLEELFEECRSLS